MTLLLRCDRCGKEAARLCTIDGIKNPDRDAEGIADGGTVDSCADLCARCYHTVWVFVFTRPRP